jgi:tetratricopeptide (TPR) repeat protein
VGTLASGTPEAPPTRDESAAVREARELTARARERFEAGDYDAALLEFERAYQQMATGDPRRAALLNNIAVCQERLFRYDLALASYQRYLDEGDPSPDDRREVEAVIRALHQLLGKLHLTSNVPAEVWVDGRSLGFAPGEFQVPAGARVVELRANGYQAGRKTLTVPARTLLSEHFVLSPLPSYHGIHRRYFWSGVALTGAFLITGAGLGIRALTLHDQAEQLQQQELLKPGDQDKMQRVALAADICFGVAGAFAISSAVLAFVTDFGKQDARRAAGQAAQAKARIQLQPVAGATNLGLRMRGAF